MTWEEIIEHIRKDPSYHELVEKAYFEEDLALNVNRFYASDEFAETMKEIKTYFKNVAGLKLLDLGAGNGVASLAFALSEFNVTAVEPDKSETIGSGAIRKAEEIFKTGRIKVEESFAENLPLENNSFDIVYIRQAMHHAYHLNDFIKQAARVLKPGGILFTVRDHVIYNEQDKQWFLESHPLHKFYGGENAFTFQEYERAITDAKLKILRHWNHYDSVINYFPEPTDIVNKKKADREKFISDNLTKKLPGFLSKNKFIKKKYTERVENKIGKALDESKIPGRLVSFLAVKQ